jgi:hypothetical protein
MGDAIQGKIRDGIYERIGMAIRGKKIWSLSQFQPRRAFLCGAVTDFLPIQWKNAPGSASVTVNGEGLAIRS